MTEFFGEREDMLHRNDSEVIGEMSPATLHLIDEHEKFRAKMASWQKAIENAEDERKYCEKLSLSLMVKLSFMPAKRMKFTSQPLSLTIQLY